MNDDILMFFNKRYKNVFEMYLLNFFNTFLFMEITVNIKYFLNIILRFFSFTCILKWCFHNIMFYVFSVMIKTF